MVGSSKLYGIKNGILYWKGWDRHTCIHSGGWNENILVIVGYGWMKIKSIIVSLV